MIDINVSHNIKDFMKGMNNVQRRQLPYAISRALNDTAVQAQETTQQLIPHLFNNNKTWWLRQQPTGIKVQFTDRRKGNLHTSAVFTNAYFAQKQEEGESRIPQKRYIAVPTNNTLKKFRKAGSAKLLMQNKKEYFATDTAIYRRLKKNKLKYIYSLTKHANVPKRFGFQDTIQDITRRNFSGNLDKRFREAMKTAKVGGGAGIEVIGKLL